MEIIGREEILSLKVPSPEEISSVSFEVVDIGEVCLEGFDLPPFKEIEDDTIGNEDIVTDFVPDTEGNHNDVVGAYGGGSDFLRQEHIVLAFYGFWIDSCRR